MVILIISIILAILVFIGCGFCPRQNGKGWGLNKMQLLLILPLLLIFAQMFTSVPANNVGIKWSIFTGTSEQTLSEGTKMKNIFDQVYLISTEMQSTTVYDITAQTRDSQYVDIDLNIKYLVEPDSAYKVFQQFRTLENFGKTLIPAVTQRAIESVTTQFNVTDILGPKQNEVYELIEGELAVRLAEYNIRFDSIVLIDTDAGEELEAAIAAEGVARQALETARQQLEVTRVNAQDVIAEAEARREAAEIDAGTKIIHAQAERDANNIAADSLTPEILEKKLIDKWDGTLPLVTNGENTMLDISGLLG
jgi:Membrane protease subunits, stomatin/prohibitin homologs